MTASSGSDPAPEHHVLCMRRLLLVLLSMTLCAVSACDGEDWFNKFIPQEEAAEGQKLIAQLAARDFNAIEPRLDVVLRTSDAREKLNQLADYIPRSSPKSVATIGAHTFKGTTDTRFDLTYEYEYETTWMIANMVLSRKADQLLIEGLHLNLVSQSQKTINAFALRDKGALQIGFLVITAVVPLFILATLVVCFRTVVAKRKWLWYLFIAIGVVQFQLNWTTGALNIVPVGFLLLGGGFTRAGPYAPYVLAFALPIGAIVFLACRKSLASRPDVGSATEGTALSSTSLADR